MTTPPHALKLLVVEDEVMIQEYIVAELQKLGYTRIRTAMKGEEAVTTALTFEPDALLLDIDLGRGISGIEVARQVSAKMRVAIVYLTQHDEESIWSNALDTNPTAYLLKPFRASQINISLMQALQGLGKPTNNTPTLPAQPPSATFGTSDAIFLKVGAEYRKVPLADFWFLEADRRYCNVVTAQHTYVVTASLQELLAQLPHAGLLRTHRSYAVRLAAITAHTPSAVTVGSQKIPISDAHKEALKKALGTITLRSK